ncbi:hypothetical protein D3C87_2122500 [compost metagenome]
MRPKHEAIIQAVTVRAAARPGCEAPSERATDDVIAPPIAPADSICVSITNGKTRARPASAVTPRKLVK